MMSFADHKVSVRSLPPSHMEELSPVLTDFGDRSVSELIQKKMVSEELMCVTQSKENLKQLHMCNVAYKGTLRSSTSTNDIVFT